MKNNLLLVEHLEAPKANLREQRVGQDIFLRGIVAQSECINGNLRKYSLSEMTREVEQAQRRIAEGHPICGELQHPDNLSINLDNVSHAITELRMEGNNAIGKLKLVNTPKGLLAKALIEGGIRLGVSTRGTGNVSESGDVTDFSLLTVDIVHQPSAPDAYPDVMAESLGSKKIMTLAEALVHDPKAQEYFKRAVLDLIAKTTGRK